MILLIASFVPEPVCDIFKRKTGKKKAKQGAGKRQKESE